MSTKVADRRIEVDKPPGRSGSFLVFDRQEILSVAGSRHLVGIDEKGVYGILFFGEEGMVDLDDALGRGAAFGKQHDGVGERGGAQLAVELKGELGFVG